MPFLGCMDVYYHSMHKCSNISPEKGPVYMSELGALDMNTKGCVYMNQERLLTGRLARIENRTL